MNVVQLVHTGLGNSSYLVDVGGGAALAVDPDRSAGRYLSAAQQRDLRIVAVLETHLHADFVSGAREIAHGTGASIYASEGARLRLPHHSTAAGEKFTIGEAGIEVVASPGHTPEHLSYVLHAGRRPPVLFSGGALIVGGAARTDLLSPAETQALTRSLFRTLHSAFSHLPDETVLYPTHGGGSFCSTGASEERSSTLGQERSSNPLLALRDEEEFAAWFPTTFPAAPSYFFRMRAINQEGPRLRSEIALPRDLPPDEFERARRHALVVDVRPKQDYARSHVPGALSNPFRDAYPLWLGWLAPPDTPLLFVTDEEPVDAVVDQSLLVGYERLAGRMEGGMRAWVAGGRQVAASPLIDAQEARRMLLDGAAAVDVRETDEFNAGHLPGALHIPLGILGKEARRLPADRPIVVYCGHGERASSGVSILERAGLGPLVNLDGGFSAWQEAGYPAG